jgi:16S rRNA (cytosine967-C5)-methyltransferase
MSGRAPTGARPGAGTAARRLAAEVVVRIEAEGAYANLALPAALADCGLSDRDRAFVTELVYGSTRMRRACDWAVDRFLHHAPDPVGRAHLRLGAYQVLFLGTPPHAAVNATVAVTPPRQRGMVNAVLRKVAAAGAPGPDGWPDVATALSYPDWVVDRLTADLGAGDARGALEAMNRPPPVTTRLDGYTQDLASQWVARSVGLRAGERALDLCAAPGGKATAMATAGAVVVAADRRRSRVRLLAGNVADLGLADRVLTVAGDGAAPPFRPRSFDRILVDAPCSGLGALRRRPDARWRAAPDDVDRLASLQRRMVDAVVPLLAPGGTLVYSVCTLTGAETVGIDDHLAAHHPHLRPCDPMTDPWRPAGRGALVLPQAADTDGMFLLRLRDGSAAPRR